MTLSPDTAFLKGAPQPLVVVRPQPTADVFELYRRVTKPGRPSLLLDSANAAGPVARYSFICSEPYLTLTGRGAEYTIQSEGQQQRGIGSAVEVLQELLHDSAIARPPGLPPFYGGAAGYLSYDLIRSFESLPSLAVDDLRLPDLHMVLLDLVAAVDHRTGLLYLMYCPPLARFLSEPREKLYREGCDRLAEFEARLTTSLPPLDRLPWSGGMSFEPGQTAEDYKARVRQCKEYIAAGDIYQANLSHRFMLHRDGQGGRADREIYAATLYHRLRQVNPSPFSGLAHLDHLSLVSCSPERLVQLTGSVANTRPIAGTRRRGATLEEDRRLQAELVVNAKERAEHVMLVDLERNDLGKVCRYGSVHVDEFMTVEPYSHVNHLVSSVTGVLAPHRSPLDLVKALFPGGTITGVPKLRCMHIIEELEPVRRGLYTGALGYFSWSGDLDLNILIRTLVLTGRQGYLQVGAGIVADSDPDREYEETLAKAGAFFHLLEGSR
ncbi:MAG: anthranilate synthase component I family protein [Nitrospirales bacterium]|nr:anthranilate synthase component I family protein [Nitrospirales bacterium]